jgi:hypothetical protein
VRTVRSARREGLDARAAPHGDRGCFCFLWRTSPQNQGDRGDRGAANARAPPSRRRRAPSSPHPDPGALRIRSKMSGARSDSDWEPGAARACVHRSEQNTSPGRPGLIPCNSKMNAAPRPRRCCTGQRGLRLRRRPIYRSRRSRRQGLTPWPRRASARGTAALCAAPGCPSTASGTTTRCRGGGRAGTRWGREQG